MLKEITLWKSLVVEGEVSDFSKEVVDAMFTSSPSVQPSFPWESDGRSDEIHFGRLYTYLSETLKRCIEELARIPIERKRLAAWLKECLRLIDLAMPTMSSASTLEATDLVEGFVLGQLGNGKKLFLKGFQHQMESLLAKVSCKI